MILLLGASGYVGQAFATELRRRGQAFVPLSRASFDYTAFEKLIDYLRKLKPQFLINASGVAWHSQLRAGELKRRAIFEANVILPQRIARACLLTRTPWAHVSCGCVFAGAKAMVRGKLRVEKDLEQEELRPLFRTHPERFAGFTELDEPNVSFRLGSADFCSGTKTMAEEAIRRTGVNYIWRLQTAFNEVDAPANFLSQLLRLARLRDAVLSLSHLEDCVRACLDLWDEGVPPGTYHVINPGAVTVGEIVELIGERLQWPRGMRFLPNGEVPFSIESSNFPSDCLLDDAKLRRTGARLRNVRSALEQALDSWIPMAPGPHPASEAAHHRSNGVRIPVTSRTAWNRAGERTFRQ